jgi:hypothetical protein
VSPDRHFFSVTLLFPPVTILGPLKRAILLDTCYPVTLDRVILFSLWCVLFTMPIGQGWALSPLPPPLVLTGHLSCSLLVLLNHILTLIISVLIGTNSFSPDNGDSTLLQSVAVHNIQCHNPEHYKMSSFVLQFHITLI